MKCSIDMSNFLEAISSLSNTIICNFFALFKEGLKKTFFSPLAFLLNSAFSWIYHSFPPLPFTSLSAVICKTSADNHFAFVHFFFLGMVLLTAFYTMLWTSFHSSSGTLSTRSNTWSICHLHCIIIRYLIQVIPEWPRGFAYFSQFKPEFFKEEFMVWATASSRSSFSWLHISIFSFKENNLISVLTIWWCPCVHSSLRLLENGVCYKQHILLTKLFAFALLHFVLQGQTYLLFQASLDFLLLHSNPL